MNAERIASLSEQAGVLSFGGAVEALQQACANSTPIGTAGPVEDEAILFRAAATLSFPPADIAEIAARPVGNTPAWPVEMQVTFLGLYGPSSPMPVAWTEDIVQDADGAQNLRDFLDVFDHPLIALAYRIAQHYRIDRQFDRALEMAAPRAIMALSGQFGGTALARTVDWSRLLPFCGLLAHTARSRETLVRIVAGYFDVPVTVEEWVPRVVPIPPDQQFALGAPQSTLGSGTVLGEGVPDVAGAVTLVMGPMPRTEFEAFLPNGAKRQELQAVLRMTLREPTTCFVDLLLDPGEVGGLMLGGAQLGWTTWQAGGDGPVPLSDWSLSLMISLDLNTSWAAGLVPVRLAVREAISQCYEMTLDVLSSDASLPLTDALRRPASVTFTQGEQRRRIPGVVTEMALLGTLPADRYWYRLTLVPRLRLLDLTRRSRVFCTEQPAMVGELLQQVIASADGVTIPSADVSLNFQTSTYPPLDMAVQYTETDLAFLSRRAEYAGIFYFFQTDDGADRVVFGDANVCFPVMAPSDLPYRPSVGVADTGPAIRSVETVARLIPKTAQLNTRDWENPGRLLLVQSDPHADGLGMHEWEEEDGYTDAAWGRALARVRAEELAVERNILRGRSDCLAMQAGRVFTLKDHDVASLNGRYVVTSVEHQAWESAAGVEFLPEQTPQGAGYGNSFTAIPLSVPFRPRRDTPMPRIAGVLRAMVDGVDQARSEVDELGCYRIILPFDRTTRPPGKSSNRIRLITPYGGASEGFHFPLRPGTQVMVGFMKGNPDWPVIVGPLYDASQKSVVTHGNRYANVITTASGITMRFYDGPPPPSS